jgi:hypothetical protein
MFWKGFNQILTDVEKTICFWLSQNMLNKITQNKVNFSNLKLIFSNVVWIVKVISKSFYQETETKLKFNCRIYGKSQEK